MMVIPFLYSLRFWFYERILSGPILTIEHKVDRVPVAGSRVHTPERPTVLGPWTRDADTRNIGVSSAVLIELCARRVHRDVQGLYLGAAAVHKTRDGNVYRVG